jgi:hypothetical protein
MPNPTMKTQRLRVITLATVTILGLGLLPAWAAWVTNIYHPIVDCPAPGQVCNKIYSVEVVTTGALSVQFTASPTHCSEIYMHVLLDGREVTRLGPLAAGEAAAPLELGPVGAGAHLLQLLAEGYKNGCNEGDIIGWGGTLEVVTSTPCVDFVMLSAHCAGTNVVVSWPTSVGDYFLESAVALPGAGSWNAVTSLPTRAEGRFWYTNNLPGPARFYRLRAFCMQ